MTEDRVLSSNSRCLFEFAVSVVPFLILQLMSWVLSGEYYWSVVLLAALSHIFHARLFVIMHDCGHYSFAASKWLNDLIGHICAWFYFIPFYMWRELHNKHHSNQGYLSKRGNSLDVWTLTVNEFEEATPLTRLCYRLYRHPLVLFVLAPFLLFLVIFRLPFERFSAKALINILVLDAIYFYFLYFHFSLFAAIVMVALPTLFLSFVMASFLFYVQHQFKNTFWTDKLGGENRNISMIGSSFLKIPSYLEWCYGYINYHHLHHLDVKIPLYSLKSEHARRLSCEQRLPALSITEALSASGYKLWDEKSGKLVSF